MSPYWAVLSLLLLLLPHAVRSESVDDKMKKFNEGGCPSPEESDCKEGKCTLHCFTYIHCGDNNNVKSSDNPSGTLIRPVDTRLLLTAAAMHTVDDTGRILESYINNYTSVWYRARVNSKNIRGYSIALRFPVGLEESKKKAAKLTDMILYMGSDFADSYEPLTYKYNTKYLQLKDGSTKIPDEKINTNSAFPICFVYEGPEGGRKVFNSPTTEQDPNNWISNPGIYRLNFASGRITELNYDPSMSSYLM